MLNTTGISNEIMDQPPTYTDQQPQDVGMRPQGLEFSRRDLSSEQRNGRNTPEAARTGQKSTSQLFTPQVKNTQASHCVTTPGPRRAPLFKNSLLNKQNSDLKSFSKRNQKLSYGFEQARKIQKSSPNKGAYRHVQFPESPVNQGIHSIHKGSNNISTRSSDMPTEQVHGEEPTVSPFKIQKSPLRPYLQDRRGNQSTAPDANPNIQGAKEQELLQNYFESFQNMQVMRGRSFGIPERDFDETPRFHPAAQLAQAIGAVNMPHMGEINKEAKDTTRPLFFNQSQHLNLPNFTGPDESELMGRFLSQMGQGNNAALNQAMCHYANSPGVDQMIEPSLLKRDSLLQRWRTGDKQLSGLFKSGLTPGRPNQVPQRPGRKKSQFFKYVNEQASSDSGCQDQRLPVAVSSFEPIEPRPQKSKISQPSEFQLHKKYEIGRQPGLPEPAPSPARYHQSKTLDPGCFVPQKNSNFRNETMDSTQLPYSHTCSGNSAVFESEKGQLQNSSWHCKRRTSHLLTPDSLMLGEMRRREDFEPSKRYLSTLGSNYSFEEEDSFRRRKSGGTSQSMLNPFLKMTPYGRSKGKNKTAQLNSALLNKQGSSPLLQNQEDHFLNESSSDNVSSCNEQEPNSGFESPRSPRKEKPTKINVELLETPIVNKSRRVFAEDEDFGTPDPQIHDLGRSPRPSESPDSLPLEPGTKRNSGDELGYNKFFLNIPLHSRFMTDYTTLEILGRGSFGTVYRCRNNIDCLEYAVKKRHKKMNSAGRMKEALTEVYALAAVCIAEENPYIVKYFSGWFQDNELYIVMELCKTSMQKIAESKRKKDITITEEEVKRIMRDVTLGLKGLHDRFIVHLDIKPENVLVSYSGKYKIGDLGLARLCIQHEDTDIQEGDSRYLAKELLNDFNHVEQIPDLRKADIFSLGAMMYELMSGMELQTNGDEWHSLRGGKPNLQRLLDRGYSYEMCEWIRRMLHPRVQERPECAELLRDFLHSPIEKQLLAEQKRNQELEAKIHEMEEKLRFYEQQRDTSVSRIEI